MRRHLLSRHRRNRCLCRRHLLRWCLRCRYWCSRHLCRRHLGRRRLRLLVRIWTHGRSWGKRCLTLCWYKRAAIGARSPCFRNLTSAIRAIHIESLHLILMYKVNEYIISDFLWTRGRGLVEQGWNRGTGLVFQFDQGQIGTLTPSPCSTISETCRLPG